MPLTTAFSHLALPFESRMKQKAAIWDMLPTEQGDSARRFKGDGGSVSFGTQICGKIGQI